MKTLILFFCMFFLSVAINAQVVKTQKVNVSKVKVQSKILDHKEPTIEHKKGLVKKELITEKKRLVIQRKNDSK